MPEAQAGVQYTSVARWPGYKLPYYGTVDSARTVAVESVLGFIGARVYRSRVWCAVRALLVCACVGAAVAVAAVGGR